MALTKQAKVLNPKMVESVLTYLSSSRYPVRNSLMFLLSVKAGLRAKEIASVTWSMVLDGQGEFTGHLALENSASKGTGGRIIPLNKAVRAALKLHYQSSKRRKSLDRIVQTERSSQVAAQTVVDTFASWYKELGYDGCSSHSGRRTFITDGARKISTVGGSLRDIQMLAGHSSLQTTQRYIEGDSLAQAKVVELL